MKKIVFLTAIAGIFAFTACNSAKQDATAEESEIQLVAKPDFVFSSGNTTLFSTFATKADPTPDPDAKDENANVEVNLSVCPAEGGQYTASKLSVHVRAANDVTVFLPVAASAFSESPASVAVFKETQTDVRTGGYGENSAYWEIDGVKVEAKAEYTAEGIQVTVTGVNDHLVQYLYDGYRDGLTVEVWNYYKDVTLSDLKAGFDAGATVSFSTQPNVYVNAFAKIPDYVDELQNADEGLPRIYSKEDETTGILTPYLDASFTTPLDSKYWIYPAEDDGEGGICSSKFYLLKGHKNAYDCVVKPTVTFSNTTTHNADVPDDAASVVYIIDSNYNVDYIK